MKKFLISSLAILQLLVINVYATPLSLSLFSDGFSLLDKIFLIGLIVVLLGAVLLVIAFLKPSKTKTNRIKSPFSAYMDDEDEDSSETPDTPHDDNAGEEDSSADSDDALPSLDEALPSPDEDEVEEIDDDIDSENAEIPAFDPEEDGTIYPKLILTHAKTCDFIILPLYPETKVGRNNENDLVLTDVTISGLHCRILNEDGTIYVQDENSTNGTFINNERLTEKTQLHHGDKLTIGKQEYNVSVNE